MQQSIENARSHLGPDGGTADGRIIATGTADQVAAEPRSITGRYLNRAPAAGVP